MTTKEWVAAMLQKFDEIAETQFPERGDVTTFLG